MKRRTAPPLRQAPPAPAPAPAPTKRELSQAEIHRAIGTRKEQFWRCLKVHKDPGLYKLKFQILPDGTVSRASPVRVPTRKEDPRPYTDLPAEVDGGKDPRSPTSACLVRWIRTVTFPRFDGWPIDSQYPLLLWER